MERKKISFDVDGVIAEGGWVPRENRTNAFYSRKKVLNAEVIPSIIHLSMMYDIYIISTRGHEMANLGLRAWLTLGLGLHMDTIAGVITYPGTREDIERDPDDPMDKGLVVRALGIAVHFDDSPTHVEACGDRGVLVPSDLPGSLEAARHLPTAPDWDTIRTFLTTPGMVLHGSNGTQVVSPATEVRVYPKVPNLPEVVVN